MTTALKLEVGKTYVDGSKDKFTILFQDGDRFVCRSNTYAAYRYRWYTVDGKLYGYKSSPFNLLKEYKEPKVHKRDVVWYTYKLNPTTLNCGVVIEGFELHHTLTELKRETVEYIEE